jgi:signal transduction histidine kinase
VTRTPDLVANDGRDRAGVASAPGAARRPPGRVDPRVLLGGLARAADVLATASDVRAAFSEVARALGEATGVDRVDLFRYVADEQVVRPLAGWARPGAVPVGRVDGGPYAVAEHRDVWAPLLAGRVYQPRPRARAGAGVSAAPGRRTDLAVPVVVDGALWGALSFDDGTARQGWTDGEIETLQAAAALVAAVVRRRVVERARARAAEARAATLAEEVTRRAHAERVATGQAAVLTRAVERLANAGPDPTTVPTTAAAVRDALLLALVEQLGGARVDLWTVDRARDVARLAVTCHADGRLEAGADQPDHPGARPTSFRAMATSPAFAAFETGECFRVGPEFDHPTHAPFRAWMDAQGLRSSLMTPVRVRGEPSAAFFVSCVDDRPFPPAERELAKAVGHLLALAFEAERLADAARAAAEAAAVLQERTRIARELHDTVAQGLAGVVMQLGAAREKLAAGARATADAAGPLDRAARLAGETLAAARRAITLLRPGAVDDGGVAPALARVVDDARRDVGGAPGAAGPAPPALAFEARGAPRRAPPDVEFELARIAQAAVANAVRHADARRIAVSLDFGPGAAGGIRIAVADDGRGFDPRRPRPGRFGLTGMRERAARVGATLTLVTAPGEGTEVVVMWGGDGPPAGGP